MNILLVKVSSLGDIVHAMPIVADILHAYPHAKIDWVAEEAFANLVQCVRGVRKVIPVALRRWRHQLCRPSTWREINQFFHTLRSTRYHAIIDAQGLLKSALLSRLAHGQVYGLANRTEGASHEWPVRFFYQQGITIPSRTHVVMRGRLLAAQALGYTLDTHIDFGLTPQFADLTLLANDPYIVFVHAASRADKAWPTTSWINLGLHLISAGYRIVLPWGSPAEKEISQTLAQTLGPRAWVPPYLALPHIAGLLEKATATIGVDTGLSHMSVALNKPTIQLYQFDTAWRTGGLSAEKFINLGSKRHPPTGIQVQAALVALGLL